METPGAKFLICMMMTESFDGLAEPGRGNVIRYLSGVCAEHVSKRNLDYVDLIISGASFVSEELSTLINLEICDSDMEELSSDPDLTFEYIEKIRVSVEIFWRLVINCAKYSPENVDDLIKDLNSSIALAMNMLSQ